MSTLDVLDARLLDVELFCHTHSVHDSADLALLYAAELAGAKQAWTDARRVRDDAAEAKAASEWYDAVQLLGTAVDGLRAHFRRLKLDGLPPMVVFVEERPTA